MSKTLVICSDVDGVILNYIQGFIEFTVDENISFRYNPEKYGVMRDLINEDELRERFHKGNYLRKLQYYSNALEVLNSLAEKFELHLVTAISPECSEKREENLADLNYTSLQCVGENDKERIILEEVVPDVMIEDHPELIQTFHAAGIKVFFPEWHCYTRNMDAFGISFSEWRKLPEMLKDRISPTPKNGFPSKI